MKIYRVIENTYGPKNKNEVGVYSLNVGSTSYFATKISALKAIREAGYKPSHEDFPDIDKLKLSNKADVIDLLNRA